MISKKTIQSLDDFNIFDSCITFGDIFAAQYPDSVTIDNIVEHLDRFRIHEAMVHSYRALRHYPRETGNTELISAIRSHPKLHPVWVTEPTIQRQRFDARREIDMMLSNGIRAVRLPMGEVSSHPVLWDDLFGELNKHGILCFLDFGKAVSTMGGLCGEDITNIDYFASRYPDLPLILSHVFGNVGVHPALLPLILKHNNIYIDILGNHDYWRFLAREGRVEQILFASGAPFVETGIYISNIQYASGLNVSDKTLIYGGNLRRLMKEMK